MLNPLRSEGEAFRLLLYVLVVFVGDRRADPDPARDLLALCAARACGRRVVGVVDVEPDGEPQRRKRELIGTIELIATLVVVLAVIAFLVWFFFFAHNPLLRV